MNKKIQEAGDGLEALTEPSGTQLEASMSTIMIPHDMILNSVTQKKDKVEMLYYTIEVE